MKESESQKRARITQEITQPRAHLTAYEEIRRQWENGAIPLMVQDHHLTEGRVLVVLQAHGGEENDPVYYHCHRYFEIGNTWDCSVDGRHVELEAVFSRMHRLHSKANS